MWERERRFGLGQLDVTGKKEGDVLVQRREMCYDVLCCHGAVGVRNGMWEQERRFGLGQWDVTGKKEGDVLVRDNKPYGLP
ncbi:hypothetical protein NDU88_003992 [Pleurodeles waltl]|uniref:Uncharacterized protein n=1 Tax=Pleurodeles waltl TaxID=8319 RepID=A0AAV7LIM4_PLEWA|nr:hypothetical protein NDU88_003992 [Pleurodeles waltl]